MKFPYQTIEKIELTSRGFYRISHEAYHAGLGVSSTRAKKALHSYAEYVNPINEDSQALAFGRAFHAAILEPELYATRYKPTPMLSRNSKAWDQFAAECAAYGKEAILDCEREQIRGMLRCIREHPEYSLLPKFDAEIMAITQDFETGLTIKCKADLFGSSIIDFKSTSSGIRPADFIHDMIKWNYHVSAAFYQDIIASIIGERLPFVVVPVTKKVPFECEFYTLSDEMLDEGRKLYKAGLRRIQRWALEPESKIKEKRMRVLHPNARMLYNTTDILNFIEAP